MLYARRLLTYKMPSWYINQAADNYMLPNSFELLEGVLRIFREYPGKRSGADANTFGSYLTTRNQRSVLVGDSNTLVLSSSICSLTTGSKNRRPSPKRTGMMPIWISSTSPARRHC